MPRQSKTRISAQAVGAYGEKAVEGELLRHGWIPSNVNASVKNAADFDIFALKAGHTVHLRVKTCGPGLEAFQFGLRPGQDLEVEKFGATDFTVLVRMGATRQDDQFYVIPTREIRETIRTYRRAYLDRAKRDGGARKDTGHWTLNLPGLRSGEDRLNYGLAAKWASYRDNWDLLENYWRRTHQGSCMINVTAVRPLASHTLEIEFSNGMIGERDFSFILGESGPLLEPLKDAAYFARVFVEDGALTWPNGYDWDPIALHDEMKAAGLLRQVVEAE